MDMSKGYYLLMLTLCCLLVEEVEADFEHMCVHEDFSRSGAYSSCGSRLTSLVISKCDGNPYLASRGKRDLEKISLTTESANSYLRPKRNYEYVEDGMGVGIICECCVNTCTIRELDQYCESKRKKRSVREILTPTQESKTYFSEREVEKFYEELKELPESEEKEGESLYTSVEEYETIVALDKIKRKNIAMKQMYLSKTSEVSGDVMSTNSKTKQNTNSNKQANIKIFSTIISGTPPSDHKHRHKHDKRHLKHGGRV
nr:insulin-like peptide A precursor [Bugula neritina]